VAGLRLSGNTRSPLSGSDPPLEDAQGLSASDELTAGDMISMGSGASNNGDLDAGADTSSISGEIQLIWEDPDSDQTQIIDSYEP